jgi:DNA-binding transcriptional ArsR family regulator
MMAPDTSQTATSTEEQAELLRVLGHPMRLAVLKELTGGERSVGDIAERTGLGLSVLSQQLAILRKAALVSSRREAKQVFYTIDADQMKVARAVLDDLVPAGEVNDPKENIGLGNARLGAAMFARVSRVTR